MSARRSASSTWAGATWPLGAPATRWTSAPTVYPSAKPPATSRGKWAPTNTRANPTVSGSTQITRRQRRARNGAAVAVSAKETAPWADGNPSPCAAAPRTITSLARAAGRPRSTRLFSPIAE
jgi:hypothetical protein